MPPQSDPKAIRMDMVRPCKTYGIYCLGSTMANLGWPRKSNFSLFAVLGCVFQPFCTAFADFGAERDSKMDSGFVAERTLKSTKRNFATLGRVVQQFRTVFGDFDAKRVSKMNYFEDFPLHQLKGTVAGTALAHWIYTYSNTYVHIC